MNAYHERITELFDEYYAAPKDDKPTPNKRIEAAELSRLGRWYYVA